MIKKIYIIYPIKQIFSRYLFYYHLTREINKTLWIDTRTICFCKTKRINKNYNNYKKNKKTTMVF